ncbi:MAG: hypothetical protein ABWY18_11555 [Tardiphaga sp.]
MAPKPKAAFSRQNAALSIWQHQPVFVMLDMFLLYQLAQRPLQAMARRWVCRGIAHVTRGEVRCPECRKD